jgi:hypothetical protein
MLFEKVKMRLQMPASQCAVEDRMPFSFNACSP